ncbi:glycosyltransferase family 4 protein [Flavobacteriaceae bacterium]|nr:glycosyltransferase family 4 protein [Flavobacteriaceae bacterium]
MSNKVCLLLLHNKKQSGLYDYAKIYKDSYHNSDIIFLSDLYPQTSQWVLFLFFFKFKKIIHFKLKELSTNYKVLHICDNPVYTSKILLLIHKLKLKTIITLHDPNAHLELSVIKKLKNLVLINRQNKSLKLISLSKFLKLHIHKPFKIKYVNKPIISPHPIYINNSINKINNTSLTIGFFGRIEYYKGIDIFIKLMKKLDKYVKKDEVSFIIAGPGNLKNMPNLKNIKFEVYNFYLESSKFNYLLSKTDLILLPYRQASQSGILMKAISYNIPVISSNLTELSAYIDDGKTGIILDVEDMNSWVVKIKELIKNKDLLYKMSLNINNFKSKFDPIIISNYLYSKFN